MKKKSLFGMLLSGVVLAHANTLTPPNQNLSSCIIGKPDTSNLYNSVKWYRDSAERNALYNQAFSVGLEKITNNVKQNHLAKKRWGVIFDVDETLFNNTAYHKDKLAEKCQRFNQNSWSKFLLQESSLATPGAVKVTCGVSKLGGYVVLVSNRIVTNQPEIVKATVSNLKKQGICFDNVLFADKNTKSDKNTRFEAVISGNYGNLTYTNKLPAIPIIAYFGDNIQDFPKITQSQAMTEDSNGKYYSRFGQEYFILPNPVYGSWEKNKFN